MMLTAERLRELLCYDPETGAFTWRVARRKCRVGDVAGTLNKTGYRSIRVDGVLYQEHRLACLYMDGGWPVDQVDHRDLDKANNRWLNLRNVTQSGNQQNIRRARANNACGFLGVHKRRGSAKWRAEIRVNGRAKYVGLFDTPEKAHAAYLAAKAVLHPFQTVA